MHTIRCEAVRSERVFDIKPFAQVTVRASEAVEVDAQVPEAGDESSLYELQIGDDRPSDRHREHGLHSVTGH